MIDVRLGDRVRWESSAGTIRGEIVGATMVVDINGKFSPFYDVELGNGTLQQICGNESYLNLMEFSVRFRDKK